MRIVVAADAGPTRGAGHVMRSLAVAEEAVRTGSEITLAADLSALRWTCAWVDALGIRLAPPAEDAAALAALAREHRADVVLLDHYGFNDARDAVHRAGAVLANFEDGVHGRRSAHVSIDYQLGAEQVDRPDDGSVVLLRGVAFAPIRAEIREARRAVADPAPADTVAVLMGGTDVCGLTGLVESAVAQAGARVAAVARGRGHVQDLVGARAVVSAAGVSAYELSCLGVPTALIQVADNQSDNYRAFTGAGAAVGLGTAEQARRSPEELSRRIGAWLSQGSVLAGTAATAQALVDGLGGRRIVTALESLLSGSGGHDVRG